MTFPPFFVVSERGVRFDSALPLVGKSNIFAFETLSTGSNSGADTPLYVFKRLARRATPLTSGGGYRAIF